MYKDGAMEGPWKRYYPSGQLMETVQFSNNEENGPFVEYYENGNLKAEGQYYHGDNEHGLLKLYAENGELIRKMECDSGRCRTIWKHKDYDEIIPD
jgi:antitoxin component YwqK of YwqJK toxin-antitoxin module